MKAVAASEGTIMITELEGPPIAAPAGHVTVRTEYSAISPGTEMSFVRKGSARPAVLGYSAVGIVERVGENVPEAVKPGMRVACYGAPYVRHSEWFTVPANLISIVPDHVKPEEAAFAGLGAIAIHALRTADARFGESVIVVGLGILGQLIAAIADAAAIRVAGLDLNAERADLLRRQGIRHAYDSRERMEEHLADAVGGHGADSVLLCAAGPGEELINASLGWIRDRGKIVVVGDLTTEFSRGLMFGKEAQVLISRAGGPGRYDRGYELENRDYPVGFVRWTEGRNVGEYIRLLAKGRIGVAPLISDTVPFERAAEAYAKYADAPSTVMGTVLVWPGAK